MLLERRDPKSALARRAETDSLVKLGKGTAAGAHRKSKRVHIYSAQVYLGRAQDAQDT